MSLREMRCLKVSFLLFRAGNMLVMNNFSLNHALWREKKERFGEETVLGQKMMKMMVPGVEIWICCSS